jgi:hypothetical protein
MCPACCRIAEIDLRQVDRHARRFDFEPDPRAVVPQLSAKPTIRQLVRLKGRSAQSCPLTEPR